MINPDNDRQLKRLEALVQLLLRQTQELKALTLARPTSAADTAPVGVLFAHTASFGCHVLAHDKMLSAVLQQLGV